MSVRYHIRVPLASPPWKCLNTPPLPALKKQLKDVAVGDREGMKGALWRVEHVTRTVAEGARGSPGTGKSRCVCSKYKGSDRVRGWIPGDLKELIGNLPVQEEACESQWNCLKTGHDGSKA